MDMSANTAMNQCVNMDMSANTAMNQCVNVDMSANSAMNQCVNRAILIVTDIDLNCLVCKAD